VIRVLLILACGTLFFFSPPRLTAQNDPASVKREAVRNMTAGRFGEAITLLDRYLQLKPEDAEGYRLRGKCYQSRGQLENAVEDLRKAASLDPENGELGKEVGRAAETLRTKVETQIDGYKRELARNPNAVDPYLQIAKAYRSIDDFRAAEQWYDGYIRHTVAPPPEILRYCEVLARASHLQKGETILQQYIQKYPQNADLQSRLGYFLLWQGKYQQSQRAFQKALSLSPSLAEARQGLVEARATEATSRQPASSPREARGPQLPDSPVDRFSRILQAHPQDEEARYSLVRALVNVSRFDEALKQLDTLSLRLADSIRVSETRYALFAVRDSVVRVRIAENLEILTDRPDNRAAILRIADYYGEVGNYQEALGYLSRYLAGLPDSAATDVRFRYARYAAWGKQFDGALAVLNMLLKSSPGNSEYQLLYGQITVWAERDLDQGIRYLNNVLRRSPTDLPALLTMSSAQVIQKNYPAARQYLDRARTIDPASNQLKAAQEFLEEGLRAESDRANFALLENARQLAASGDCPGAVKKYEEYFARVPKPGRTVQLAYADAQSCAKNHKRAIEICDQLLAEEYDFDVALMKAKNVLWGGDSLEALSEFTKLRAEKPENFAAGLFLGESYQGMGRTEEARKVFQGLLDRGVTGDERELVLARMRYLPLTGFSGALASFPTRVALSPPMAYYSDNQDFSMAAYGGRLELGITNSVAVGLGYSRTVLRSDLSTRTYDGLKAQLFIHLSDRLSASGSLGTLSSPGKPEEKIGDAAIVYDRPGVLRLGAYAEGSDAAVLLYTPYLIDLKYEARIYKFLGTYLTPTRWRIQGYYKVVSVSDGNTGRELQIRLGRGFFDELFMGYEYLYTDFSRQPPFVPFTNRSRQLYYAPQNLESHYLWAEWQAQADQTVTVTFSAKAGYMPSYRATVREISGEIEDHLTPEIGLRGIVAIGNTYRIDGNYSYTSVGASLYWTIL
jgi:tetratricopeptide (TPR) repeat protein